jgi:hypothetical protein
MELEIEEQEEVIDIPVHAMGTRPQFKKSNRPKLPPLDPKEPQWFPKDDKTKTTKGFSPKEKMRQPEFKGKSFRCRWCWSIEHWGKECKHNEARRKKLLEWHSKRPKVNAMTIDAESSSEEEEPWDQAPPLEDASEDDTPKETEN